VYPAKRLFLTEIVVVKGGVVGVVANNDELLVLFLLLSHIVTAAPDFSYVVGGGKGRQPVGWEFKMMVLMVNSVCCVDCLVYDW
jgi:hypothetical protein